MLGTRREVLSGTTATTLTGAWIEASAIGIKDILAGGSMNVTALSDGGATFVGTIETSESTTAATGTALVLVTFADTTATGYQHALPGTPSATIPRGVLKYVRGVMTIAGGVGPSITFSMGLLTGV